MSSFQRIGTPRAFRPCLEASVLVLTVAILSRCAVAQEEAPSDTWRARLPHARPVPLHQAIPLPHNQVSLQFDGEEVTRYVFSTDLKRPFLFPVNGPSGTSLTRMGHPHDPVGHSHHNSIWISHHSVNGVDFWSDTQEGRIVHQRILELTDSDKTTSVTSENRWQAGNRDHLLRELRRIQVEVDSNGNRLIIIDLLFEPLQPRVTFDQTPFGLVGVRMAKTIGINDGGGEIRNSEGQVGEQGLNGCFRKPAKWCDYSGLIRKETPEGITLLDDPRNVGHPTPFHVRADGWMGACFTLTEPITIEQGESLRLRYGIYVHRGVPSVDAIQNVWQEFARRELEPF